MVTVKVDKTTPAKVERAAKVFNVYLGGNPATAPATPNKAAKAGGCGCGCGNCGGAKQGA